MSTVWSSNARSWRSAVSSTSSPPSHNRTALYRTTLHFSNAIYVAYVSPQLHNTLECTITPYIREQHFVAIWQICLKIKFNALQCTVSKGLGHVIDVWFHIKNIKTKLICQSDTCWVYCSVPHSTDLTMKLSCPQSSKGKQRTGSMPLRTMQYRTIQGNTMQCASLPRYVPYYESPMLGYSITAAEVNQQWTIFGGLFSYVCPFYIL